MSCFSLVDLKGGGGDYSDREGVGRILMGDNSMCGIRVRFPRHAHMHSHTCTHTNAPTHNYKFAHTVLNAQNVIRMVCSFPAMTCQSFVICSRRSHLSIVEKWQTSYLRTAEKWQSVDLRIAEKWKHSDWGTRRRHLHITEKWQAIDMTHTNGLSKFGMICRIQNSKNHSEFDKWWRVFQSIEASSFCQSDLKSFQKQKIRNPLYRYPPDVTLFLWRESFVYPPISLD